MKSLIFLLSDIIIKVIFTLGKNCIFFIIINNNINIILIINYLLFQFIHYQIFSQYPPHNFII